MYFCNGKNTCFNTWRGWRHYAIHHLLKHVLLSAWNPCTIIINLFAHIFSSFLAAVVWILEKIAKLRMLADWSRTTTTTGTGTRTSTRPLVVNTCKRLYTGPGLLKLAWSHCACSMFWFCCHSITNGWILLKFGTFMYFFTRNPMEQKLKG